MTTTAGHSTSDATTLRRQLKIKSGVVQRLLKECTLYRQEAEAQQRAVDGHAAAGSLDEWELRNQRRLLEEARKMVPEAQRLLGIAVADLRELVVRARGDAAFQEDEGVLRAEELLGEASV